VPDHSNFDIERLVETTRQLVSFPLVVTTLLQKINDDHTSIRDIAVVIKQDPAITSELIRICNSPMYYTSGPPVCSVEEAIKRIGTEQVTSLCLALCACSATDKLANEVIELRDYWHHCLLTACLGSALAEQTPTVSRGAAFTGGLLHDVGQLPLFHQHPVESGKILEYCQLHDDNQIVNAELEIFGFTHEEVGARLAEKWGFPPQLGLCLSSHHTGKLVPGKDDLAILVHVSNILSEALETEEDPEPYLEAIDPQALAFAAPDRKALTEIFAKASSYFDDVQSSILV